MSKPIDVGDDCHRNIRVRGKCRQQSHGRLRRRIDARRAGGDQRRTLGMTKLEATIGIERIGRGASDRLLALVDDFHQSVERVHLHHPHRGDAFATMKTL